VRRIMGMGHRKPSTADPRAFVFERTLARLEAALQCSKDPAAPAIGEHLAPRGAFGVEKGAEALAR